MVARLCYLYKWTKNEVLWNLTLGQALMFYRYGVEAVTGEDPNEAEKPDKEGFRNREGAKYTK